MDAPFVQRNKMNGIVKKSAFYDHSLASCVTMMLQALKKINVFQRR